MITLYNRVKRTRDAYVEEVYDSPAATPLWGLSITHGIRVENCLALRQRRYGDNLLYME